jgi:hypothetical protein
MITLPDCISILDAKFDSREFVHFLACSIEPKKLRKEGGYRASCLLKKDGVNVHFEYVDKEWIVLAVHLYGKKESGFSIYPGDLGSGITLKQNRVDFQATFGPATSTGGDGKLGTFSIVNRWWDRWDYDGYSLRVDYEADHQTVYVACIQRTRDVVEFEKRRKAIAT